MGRVLCAEDKELLFRTAGSKSAWMVAHCAAVLAVSTTCRGVELKHLRWQDVDLFDRYVTVRRSKTQSGQRTIPLNADAIVALTRLRKRAELNGTTDPDHFVFPACENEQVDGAKPQKTWRTAWRSLTREAAKRAGAGAEAAKLALENGTDERAASQAAATVFEGFRFHDLRHQAITELAERGTSDATVMALAGHMSRAMMEHYSHARMAAKRVAVEGLETGLIQRQNPVSDSSTTAIH